MSQLRVERETHESEKFTCVKQAFRSKITLIKGCWLSIWNTRSDASAITHTLLPPQAIIRSISIIS